MEIDRRDGDGDGGGFRWGTYRTAVLEGVVRSLLRELSTTLELPFAEVASRVDRASTDILLTYRTCVQKVGRNPIVNGNVHAIEVDMGDGKYGLRVCCNRCLRPLTTTFFFSDAADKTWRDAVRFSFRGRLMHQMSREDAGYIFYCECA